MLSRNLAGSSTECNLSCKRSVIICTSTLPPRFNVCASQEISWRPKQGGSHCNRTYNYRHGSVCMSQLLRELCCAQFDCFSLTVMVGGISRMGEPLLPSFTGRGGQAEARSSLAERCLYMADEGVQFLPRLPPAAPVTNKFEVSVTPSRRLLSIPASLMILLPRAGSARLMAIVSLTACVLLAACGPALPPSAAANANAAAGSPGSTKGDEYVIGAGDSLSVFVYRNPDLSEPGVAVRPDGRISTPLIDDLTAAGKTPTQLAHEIEDRLKKYIQDPTVTVIVRSFVGPVRPADQGDRGGHRPAGHSLPRRHELARRDDRHQGPDKIRCWKPGGNHPARCCRQAGVDPRAA